MFQLNVKRIIAKTPLYHQLLTHAVTFRTSIWYNTSVFFFSMAHPQPTFTQTQDQPLIGIPFEENGKEVIRYFSEEELADRAVTDDATDAALNLAGAWSDLSWEEMEEALDRIRHDSKPTPPLTRL